LRFLIEVNEKMTKLPDELANNAQINKAAELKKMAAKIAEFEKLVKKQS
jgi:hypothetical protein